MFRENTLKRKLAARQKVLGCWISTCSPIVAEIIGLAGYDFVIIDHEHGPGGLESAIGILQALSSTPTTALMRVPWNDPVYLKRALDIGVEGVMIPMVESGEQARAAVAACLYPPAGIRGCASRLIRGSEFGIRNEDYLARINQELVIMCQIESAAAVDSVADMAPIDGIDVLFIGPNDLAGSIGKPGQTADPEARALIERAEQAVKDSGKAMATVPYAGMSWQDLFDRGYDMVAGASDVTLLRTGALADVAAHRSTSR